MSATTNLFAQATNFPELEEHYDYLTSPENLSADGERSTEEIESLKERINRDYRKRESELSSW